MMVFTVWLSVSYVRWCSRFCCTRVRACVHVCVFHRWWMMIGVAEGLRVGCRLLCRLLSLVLLLLLVGWLIECCAIMNCSWNTENGRRTEKNDVSYFVGQLIAGRINGKTGRLSWVESMIVILYNRNILFFTRYTSKDMIKCEFLHFSTLLSIQCTHRATCNQGKKYCL